MKQYGYRCIKKGTEGNEKLNILLVYPKTGADASGFSLHMPLSLLCLCTNLMDFSVAIFDERVDPICKLEQLLEEQPICVGISTMTGKQIEYALGLAQIVKRKGIPTVFGGVHPTLLPEQTIMDDRVDFLIVGEGEGAFREIVEKIRDGYIPHNVTYGKEADMNRVNLMKVYELVDIEKYINNHMLDGRCLPFQFSRGCPFKCTFCCNTVLSKSKWRTQSLDMAIPILNEMVQKYKLDSIWFVDENLTVNKNVIYKLAESINSRFEWYIQARADSFLNLDIMFLEKMGLKSIGIGLESGSDRILTAIKKQESTKHYIEANKKLAESKIKVWYNYMMGYPGETLDDVRDTINLALKVMDDNPNAYNNTFYLLTPYPGTEVGEMYYKEYMPSRFEEWSKFGRHNIEAKWHTPEMLKVYSRITFSSKFVGKKMIKMFSENKPLADITCLFTDKWRNFDFFNEDEWEELVNRGYNILKELFGENAY